MLPTPSSRLFPSCDYLRACLRINLPVLFITRFYREIFCRDGGHVQFGLLRLYCGYFCLTMPLIGGGGLGVLYTSCLVRSSSSLFYLKERTTLALDDVPQDTAIVYCMCIVSCCTSHAKSLTAVTLLGLYLTTCLRINSPILFTTC